jgi:hypothetical protein
VPEKPELLLATVSVLVPGVVVVVVIVDAGLKSNAGEVV